MLWGSPVCRRKEKWRDFLESSWRKAQTDKRANWISLRLKWETRPLLHPCQREGSDLNAHFIWLLICWGSQLEDQFSHPTMMPRDPSQRVWLYIHIRHQIDLTSGYCALYRGTSWGENGCSKRRQAGSCVCTSACVGQLFSFSFFSLKRCTWAFSKTQQAGHYSLHCHLQPFHLHASVSFLSLFHTIHAQANCVSASLSLISWLIH